MRPRSGKVVLLEKRGVEEWDDPSKMKRFIILNIKFKGKEGSRG